MLVIIVLSSPYTYEQYDTAVYWTTGQLPGSLTFPLSTAKVFPYFLHWHSQSGETYHNTEADSLDKKWLVSHFTSFLPLLKCEGCEIGKVTYIIVKKIKKILTS